MGTQGSANGGRAGFNRAALCQEEKLVAVLAALDRAYNRMSVTVGMDESATRDDKVLAFAEVRRVRELMDDVARDSGLEPERDAKTLVDAIDRQMAAKMAASDITEAEVRANVRHHMSSTGGRMVSPGFSRRTGP